MSNHTVKYRPLSDGNVIGTCSCRQTSGIKTRADAEAWEWDHLQVVERVRTHLGTRNPSLEHQRDHYRRMELDPDVPESDRALWRQLREELDHRLNDQIPVRQDPLF